MLDKISSNRRMDIVLTLALWNATNEMIPETMYCAAVPLIRPRPIASRVVRRRIELQLFLQAWGSHHTEHHNDG